MNRRTLPELREVIRHAACGMSIACCLDHGELEESRPVLRFPCVIQQIYCILFLVWMPICCISNTQMFCIINPKLRDRRKAGLLGSPHDGRGARPGSGVVGSSRGWHPNEHGIRRHPRCHLGRKCLREYVLYVWVPAPNQQYQQSKTIPNVVSKDESCHSAAWAAQESNCHGAQRLR